MTLCGKYTDATVCDYDGILHPIHFGFYVAQVGIVFIS